MSHPDEQLNGLLDGELSPREAAEAAEALRGDPGLVSHFAALARLRATTASLDADVPVPVIRASSPQRRRLATRLTAGAALIAASMALLVSTFPREPGAVAAHRRFLATAEDPSVAAPGVLDLTAAGLRLVRVEPVEGGNYAGYVGPHGCRLGLWTGPRAATPAGNDTGWRIKIVDRDDGRAVWIAASQAMDAMRFAELSEALRSSSPSNALLATVTPTRSACNSRQS